MMNRYNLAAFLIFQLALALPAHAQRADFQPCPRDSIETRAERECLTHYAPLTVYDSRIQNSAHIICKIENPGTRIYIQGCDSRGWCRIQFDRFEGFVPTTVVTDDDEEVKSFKDCGYSGDYPRSYRSYRERY
jgi:hypothetical protein